MNVALSIFRSAACMRVRRERSGAIWLTDVGSTNGTYVNGERIQRRQLEDQDVVTVGDHSIRFLLQPPVAVSGQTAPMRLEGIRARRQRWCPKGQPAGAAGGRRTGARCAAGQDGHHVRQAGRRRRGHLPSAARLFRGTRGGRRSSLPCTTGNPSAPMRLRWPTRTSWSLAIPGCCSSGLIGPSEPRCPAPSASPDDRQDHHHGAVQAVSFAAQRAQGDFYTRSSCPIPMR